MRSGIRKFSTWLFAGCLGAIVVAVLGEFFIEVAKDKGLYQDAGKKWDRAMGAISDFATSHYVLYPMVALGGVVVGLWADWCLRKFDKSRLTDTENNNNSKDLTFSTPEQDSQNKKQQSNMFESMANDRLTLANAIGDLRAAILNVRNRQSGAEEEWAANRKLISDMSERFAFENEILQGCNEVVHLADMIVDSIRSHQDYRGEWQEFFDFSKAMQKKVLLIE